MNTYVEESFMKTQKIFYVPGFDSKELLTHKENLNSFASVIFFLFSKLNISIDLQLSVEIPN